MNLTDYMSNSIQNIVQEALKSSLKNPKESAFLLQFALAAAAAQKKRSASEKHGIHIPPFLIASIASTCNLYCKGCYARANHACGELHKKEELSAERWGELFRQAEELGISFVLLAGGEPFMRRDVIEQAAARTNIIFPIFTNGTMLDEAYLTLLEKRRNLIPVLSIEGDEAQTDARRGQGVYQTLAGAMERLTRKGVLYGASVTVTAENINEVTGTDFIDMLYRQGCKLVFFVEYVPVEESTVSLAPGDRERAILEEKQSSLRQKYDTMIFLSFPGDEKKVGGCLAAGRGFFHINAAGSAEPCPFSPYSDTSLKNGSLLDALQSPLFRTLNEDGLLSKEHSGGCTLFQEEQQVRQLLQQ